MDVWCLTWSGDGEVCTSVALLSAGAANDALSGGIEDDGCSCVSFTYVVPLHELVRLAAERDTALSKLADREARLAAWEPTVKAAIEWHELGCKPFEAILADNNATNDNLDAAVLAIPKEHRV